MKRTRVLGLAAGLLVVGCSEWKTGGNIGGANQGVRQAGNRQGGIPLAEGEVAVAPNGKFFATLRDGKLVVGEVGASNGTVLSDLPEPERIAFWEGAEQDGLFVLANGKKNGGPDRPQVVLSWSRAQSKELWRTELARRDRWIDVTSDGRRVLLTGDDMLIADAATGSSIATHVSVTKVRDVDVTKDGRFAIVTEETDWSTGSPKTRVAMRNTDDGSTACEVQADNCADELVLTDDENRAFLAPTLCQQDPVTVLALSSDGCEVEEQMPGFGPVALSADGKTAVAFLDRDAPVAEGFPTVPADVKASDQRYHLMYIDTETLSFRTQPFGNVMPRYAFTPDSQELLVDMPMDPLAQVEVIKVIDGARRVVRGLPIKLHTFTIAPGGKKAFIINDGLFELDIAEAALRPVPLNFIPSKVNLTPDGLTLLVTNAAQDSVVFFNTDTHQEKGRAAF